MEITNTHDIVDQVQDESDEEYDPWKPNDYEQILMRRKRLEKQMQTKQKLLEKQRIAQEQALAAKEKSKNQEKDVILDLSAEDAYKQRVMKSSNQNAKVKKMMESMGWKGKGLGREEQGILNPLITKKAYGSSTTGVIVESTIQNPTITQHE